MGQLPDLLVGGALLGAAVSPVIRWCGLRFEWPALGQPVAAGLWLVDRELAVLVGTAALVALLSGARRHRRELSVGGDVAAWARQRVGVPAAVRARSARRAATHGRASDREDC